MNVSTAMVEAGERMASALMNAQIAKTIDGDDLDLIIKIAKRAQDELFDPCGIEQTMLDTTMDLSAVIAQGCPLRLQELLEADAFNFAHDLFGIRRHINRHTGVLEDCFLPRFYDNSKEVV